MCEPSSDFLFRGGRLFQEYLCISFTTIQSQKLKFHRRNQKALRADTYKNVKEVLSDRVPITDKVYNDDHQLKVGKKIVLSGSFPGSPRWYNVQFQDRMAICREYHKQAQDRPDLVARVFKLKKDKLMKEIVFGKVIGREMLGLIL
jgi:hypothetical protein